MLVAVNILSDEARALLTRVERMKPYSLLMPSVHASSVSRAALTVLETHMAAAKKQLYMLVTGFLRWLLSEDGGTAPPAEAQRRFTLVRLRFNSLLSQFDIFADVLNQRSEHETGTWVAGLDAVAADALALPEFYEAPPVICYIDRGHGAAIRRARTRLPGGESCPVAVIRVPRERMVGSGIASSLVHEVGHQGAALLELESSLRPVLQGLKRKGGPERIAWLLWERWISEILADFWAVARVGVSATLGLMAVVSLPRAFVFRVALDDPHPIPWIRVKLSCAVGKVLYPHPQWDVLSRLWEAYYPRSVGTAIDGLLTTLEGTMPAFVALLVHHRPPRLRGRSLREALGCEERQPSRLTQLLQAWSEAPSRMAMAPPTLVFAVLGHARAVGRITPELDSANVARLLESWALRQALQ